MSATSSGTGSSARSRPTRVGRRTALRHDEHERDDRDQAAGGEPEKEENGGPAEPSGVEYWPGARGDIERRVTATIRAIPDR